MSEVKHDGLLQLPQDDEEPALPQLKERHNGTERDFVPRMQTSDVEMRYICSTVLI